MRIGIEAQRIFRPQKYGMDIVAIELIRHLQQLDKKNEYLIFVRPDEDICIQGTDNFRIHYIDNGVYPIWEQYYLPQILKKTNIELLHCTSNTAPLFLKIPFALTLHDVISLEHNAKYQMSFYQEMGRVYRKWLIPKIIPKSNQIITVSHAEEQNIHKIFPDAKEKTVVIHNGVDKKFIPVGKAIVNAFLDKYQLEKSYISFIGNTDPRKNIHHVLLAYSAYLKLSDNPMSLVILHFAEDQLIKLLKKLGISNIRPHIKILAYLDKKDMAAFYSSSEIFLFPSLREGFGLPVLEAMACGTPVITSNVSSMPEVAGDAALFVDPFNVDDIALNLLYLEAHPAKRQELREKGFERIRHFSWEKMAENVLEIYKKILF